MIEANSEPSKVEKIKTKEPEVEIETARKVSLITLARVDKYEDLNALTEQNGNEKFLEKTRELWKEFAVHGVYGKDAEGKPVILNYTDLDGKCALALLNLAHINTKNVKYVKSGEHIPGMINIDTGDKHGLVIEDEGKTAFFDHHAKESGRDTSATKLVYEALTSVGLLESTWGIKKLVEFVTQVDNGEYPDAGEKYKDSYNTVYGLRNFIQPDKLIDYLARGKSPDENLSDEDLTKLGRKPKEGKPPELITRSKDRKETIEKSREKIGEMENDGFVLKSEKHGTIVVDTGKPKPIGWDAVQGYGGNTYIIWSPADNSFFISADHPLKVSFPQGRAVRETMYIKPRGGEPLDVDLKDILFELTDGEYPDKRKPEGKLKEFLDDEATLYRQFRNYKSLPPELRATQIRLRREKFGKI